MIYKEVILVTYDFNSLSMSKAKGKPKTPTNAAPGGGAWEASLASTLVDDVSFV